MNTLVSERKGYFSSYYNIHSERQNNINIIIV